MMPEHFRQQGYESFGVGKWHNGPDAYARAFSSGAEIFFGGMDDHWQVPACAFAPDGRYPPPRPHPMKFLPWEETVIDKRFDHIGAKHSSELFADAACSFLRSHSGDQPFFAYISFMAPHDPRTMPAEYRERYNPATLPLPPNLAPAHPFDNGALDLRDELLANRPRVAAEIREHLADYYAMITHLDVQIGQILETLRQCDALENTIVILAGDNGLAVGQHGLLGKQNMYDHSVRVPLIMMGPGIPAGLQTDALCYLIDIFPTLCQLADLPLPATVEGLSLLPLLRSETSTHRPYLHFAYTDCQRAVTDGRYKLIEYRVDGTSTTQLFDRQRDPWEQHDLSANPDFAETVANLRIQLHRWYTDYDDRAISFWIE